MAPISVHYDISFVLVNWNTKSLLLSVLGQIRRETVHRSVEIIVVDNGSSDGSVDAVREGFPGVLLIENHENAGFAQANNQAMARASGIYYCLLNTDIDLNPGCIDVLFDFMERTPEVGLCGPLVYNPDTTIQHSCRKRETMMTQLYRVLCLDEVRPELLYHSGVGIRDVDVMSGCFWFVRAQAVKKVGFLDGWFYFYGEDKDWCRRFWDTGQRVVLVPDATVIHFGSQSSNRAPYLFFEQQERAFLQYWFKYNGLISSLLYIYLRFLYHCTRAAINGILWLFVAPKREENRFKCLRSIKIIGWFCSLAFVPIYRSAWRHYRERLICDTF